MVEVTREFPRTPIGGVPMFRDRVEAGRALGHRLTDLRDDDVVVVGLPRGGVLVAAEVARALQAPLDVIVVRKVGVPWQPELAMGAVGEDGVAIVNPGVLEAAHIRPGSLAAAQALARTELNRRVRALRGQRPRTALTGRTVVIVDDGIATGATARAACRVARAAGAARIVVAVPVAPARMADVLAEMSDRVVVLEEPADLHAVGDHYQDFAPVADDDVFRILRAAAGPPSRPLR
jgi:putative phosphoribosyl transferase